MYHPGYSDHQLEAIDSVTTQRENEFVYLESDDFYWIWINPISVLMEQKE
jgi:predicted glycoside hydrolase/deacetylase ChbG (UPF0249 family)